MLIVGCGYLGGYVGRLWLAKGHQVYAVTRSAERASLLRAQGFQPIAADVFDPQSLKRVPPSDTLLYSVGPRGDHNVPRWKLYRDGLAYVLDTVTPARSQIALISSTGVYGGSAKEWIREDHPKKPQRESSRALAAAEDLLLSPAWRERAFIFRLGGLYGPDRIPLLTYLLQGQHLPTCPDVLLNLIHVEDAATAIDLVLHRGTPPCVVNVVDGHPVMRRDFYHELSELLGVAPPQFAPPAGFAQKEKRSDSSGLSGDTTRRHGAGSKRAANDLLVNHFGMVFRYPDYRSGLADVVKRGLNR
ncbi:MAG: NAD-dependent epimerase/dehydratase family protein [Thermogutta sp.]